MSKAIIVGGGIAGSVAAMALQRAGIEATVFEAHPEGADEAGAFLTLAVNGLDALRTLDLNRQVMRAGFPTRRIRFVSGSGKALGEMPIGGELSDGTVTRTLKRPDLYRVLRDEAVRRGIRIEHGRRLIDAHPTTKGGVVCRFEDGSEAEADVLVGADGVHSRTRGLIDADNPAPRHIPLSNVGGYTRVNNHGGDEGAYVMLFGYRAFFGYTLDPSGEIWWFANTPSPEPLSREQLSSLASKEGLARLAQYFSEDAGPAAEIIRNTESIVATNTYDLPRVPRWTRDSLVVIGDAAHAASPSSGQGASMAIEDAIVLARCLRDEPSSREALAAYERSRRPRVERVVALGARSSANKALGPIGRAIRDLVLPIALKHLARQSQDWLFRHHIEWDEPAPVEA